MNLLDLGILCVIGASVAFGLYSGLLSASLSTLGLVISWVCAIVMYPSLSRWIVENTTIINTIIHYTEGASHLSSLEIARAPVAGWAAAGIWEVIGQAKLPAPFENMLFDNIASGAFSQIGLVSFADYFNYTLAFAALNILSFLTILLTVFCVFSIIKLIVGAIVRFPVLRQFDSLLGGAFGLARGMFFVFALFSLVPLVLASLPLGFVQDMLETSKLAPFFYDNNFILNVIRGVL